MTHNSIRTQAGLPLLVRHVAVRLGMAERTVRWLAQTGRLQGHRLNVKVWGFDETAVAAFECNRYRSEDAA